MKVLLTKNMSKEEMEKELSKLEKKKAKKSNLKSYIGKINFGVEGLSYQKAVRNEWD